MVFFRAHALATLVLHGPKDVVDMNTTPEGEGFLKNARGIIANTDFENATSLFQHSPDGNVRDICSGPISLPSNALLSV